MTALRSQKQEREQLRCSLRAQGKSWVEIAEDFRQRYRVNGRVAFRFAHGWSQQRTADEWNSRWPDDLKTHKNFSYWELWPGSTGHAPSIGTLERLAELFQCSVADLLVDCGDYRQLDRVPAPTSTPGTDRRVAGGNLAPRLLGGTDLAYASEIDRFLLDPMHPPAALGEAREGLAAISYDFIELARVIMTWTNKLEHGLDRRAFLTKLGTALVMAAAAPVMDVADFGSPGSALRMLDTNSAPFDPVDPAALDHAEAIIRHCRHQGDVLGPELTLQTAVAQRHILQRYASMADEQLRPRALVTYAEVTQLVGWFMFNLGSYRAAQYCYDEARAAAHDAKNTELVTYVLCTMSHLATWQGKPRVGIDHALAASAWAQQTNNPQASAYAADVSARAFAADGQPAMCDTALEQEQRALADISVDLPASSWWYFYDESFALGTRSECSLQLGRANDALDSARRSLGLVDPANVHNYALTLSLQGEACILQQDITEASQVVGDVAQLTAVNHTARIAQRIMHLRATLSPWNGVRAVKQLDERLRTYGFGVSGSGNTNKS